MTAPDDEGPAGTNQDDVRVEKVMNDGAGSQGEDSSIANSDVEGEEAEGEADAEDEDEDEAVAARCSTPEQDDNTRSQLEKTSLAATLIWRTKTTKDRAVPQRLHLSL